MLKPREKLIEYGISGLTNHELIALLLGTGTSKKNVFQLAKYISNKLQTIKVDKRHSDITQKIFKQISSIKGIGISKAARIVSGIELGARLYRLHNYTVIIRSAKDAVDQIQFIQKYKQEHFIALLLNARLELIKKVTLAIGSISAVPISTRAIITHAIEANATQIILSHNHPSGDPTPSQEDILATRQIKEALQLVDTEVIDHIIIASNGWFSMKDHGII
jgi:DNA repair protein RadC